MYKLLRTGILIMCATLIGYMASGCSDDPIEEVDEPVKINLLATSPENGGTIPATGDLRIVFDGPPNSVTVDGRPAIILANTAFVTITDLPNVIPGTEKTVIIEWRNPDNSVAGAKTITFTVLKPVADSPQSDDDDDDEVAPPSATAVFVNPAAGTTIPLNQPFTLTFDQGVTAATVNGTPAVGSGLNWTASPAGLSQGSATLSVEWTNRDGSTGSQAVGPYTIDDPDVEPPMIAGGTVADWDVDVDPAPINVGGFRFDFDEPITGSIKLTDEVGADLNWIAYVGGQTVTLTAVAGQEIANETVYKIEIDVQDGAGNRTRRTITFVTEANPDVEPPMIAGGTVADWDVDVDPAPINAGGFRFDFDEPITGSIKLTDEAGADLNWIANVGGQTATLTAVAGQEIANETVYKIEIDVQDGAGNRTRRTITFATEANPDVEPPMIAGGTVADWDVDVDPVPINVGGFRFDFDEPITGSIKLTDEAGADLNWIANVGGQTATLTVIAGQELANETTYKIEIDVKDGAGNRTRRTITFVTKAKE